MQTYSVVSSYTCSSNTTFPKNATTKLLKTSKLLESALSLFPIRRQRTLTTRATKFNKPITIKTITCRLTRICSSAKDGTQSLLISFRNATTKSQCSQCTHRISIARVNQFCKCALRNSTRKGSRCLKLVSLRKRWFEDQRGQISGRLGSVSAMGLLSKSVAITKI